jgi:two-component system phosphate regulon sensor histidine kinase PhoR
VSAALTQTLALTLLGAVPAVVLGILVSPATGWALMAALLLLQLLHALRYFSRLEAWSRNPAASHLEGSGAWDGVFARLYRHERQLRSEIAHRDDDLRQVEAAGQAIVDGIVTLDAEGRIRWCNATAGRHLGLDLRSDHGQPIINLVRDPAFVAFLGAGDYRQPLRLLAPHDPEQVLSIHLLPYAAGLRLMQVRDVTQTERIDQMRRDFVANVSHELRTPLTILGGFLETVRELELTPDERERYLQMMADQSDRMLRLVQDLLTLSSLESSPRPGGERVAMGSLLQKLRADAEALSGGRHLITLEAEEVDVLGAESELVSAFGNLVSNAVRYTPAGGHIRIEWCRRGSSAEFSVTDDGIGIAPAHLPRLTERFYRADLGRSRETGGTGLGLAIVKHALSRHQAQLDVVSKPGEGSRFSALFPPARLSG